MLNLFFGAITGLLVWLSYSHSSDEKQEHEHHHDEGGKSWADQILTILAYASFVWLAGGLLANLAA